MQTGFSVNSYNASPYFGKQSVKSGNHINFGAQMQNQMQNTQISQNPSAMQNSQFASSSMQSQNTPKKRGSNKLLIGALVTLAGAAAIAIACKIKGKESKGAAKAAGEAANVVGAAGEKAAEGVENAADNITGAAEASKQTVIQKVKNKAKSFFGDVKKGYEECTPKPDASSNEPTFFDKVKKGYDEYTPASSNSKNKPAGTGSPNASSGAAQTSKPKSPKVLMREKIAETLTSFNDLMPSIEKAANETDELAKINITPGASGDKGETEKWTQKIIDDFSSVQDSSVKRTGIGKKNAFSRKNADSWSYFEGYSESSKIVKVKRRINVDVDGVTVINGNVKNNKKNIETAEELFKFDKATGEIRQYSSEIQKYADGKIAYAKRADFDVSGAMCYTEGSVEYADGSVESLIRYNIKNGVYYENSKINADGAEEAGRKIQLHRDKKPAYQMEGYKKSAAGEISADTKIEFAFGTGEPKYYFENYTYSPVDGKETYTLKAEFKEGKWCKCK